MLDSTVVFSEIMYNPAGGNESLEWIELHNQMSVDMNLSGWSLQEGVEFTFPQGTILTGGSYLVVAASPEALQASQGVEGALGPLSRQLSNSGERLELRNHTGRLMDAIEFRDDGDWPAAADGSGASLAKTKPQSASEPFGNWSFSTALGGTPGAANVTADRTAAGQLRLNEVTSADADAFWLELLNDSTETVSLAGYRLTSSEGSDQVYEFPVINLSAGEYLVVTESTLGFRPAAGERIFLIDAPHEQLFDGVRVEDRAKARSQEQGGQWQYPSSVTPGAANQFVFHDQIVINEIMYHARPTYSTPAVYGADIVLPIDAVWRFEQSGTDFGEAWREPGFDDSQWNSGQGLFYLENAELPGPKNTPLQLGQVTYYFRTEFQWDGPLDEVQIALRHVVDDGAVFYLNGVEFSRFNMPSGLIDFATTASSAVGNAGFVGPEVLPAGLLRAGTNTLAVEVHQNLAFSPDVVFGADLSIERLLTAETPFAESDEEWIELYNRSSETVDLGGWTLSGAVEFEMPARTTLGPGQFLVIANDADSLAAMYPGIHVAGEFSGRLSDGSERLRLYDAQDNLADDVEYFDGGRWPEFADGGGSSLELVDPDADNSRGESWAASDERERTTWNHFSYTANVAPIVFDPPINFNEFVMGLLGPGEVWIDNLSVVESPDGSRTQLIQNGSFEEDVIGQHAAHWRLVGTHQNSEVIADPQQAGNQVLRLVADSRMNYLSNHAETTLANGARVVDGRTYEISFDAKWITGSPQLHTELYYKDAARTTILPEPAQRGTPGGPNSSWDVALGPPNLGPTYDALRHDPLIPLSTEDVTVTVQAEDPDGIAQMQLFYAVDGIAPFTSIPMTAGPLGQFHATIPAQASRKVVQFYVQGEDQQGAVTMFPAAGPESRALYQVVSSLNLNALRQDFRLLMIPADSRALHERTNMVDNNRLGSTVIYNGDEVFYDVGGRLKGSMFSRQNISSTGYNVRFNPDQLFRGVHDTVRFDQNGESEILVKYFAAAIGNLGGSYDDVLQLTTPSGQGGGPTLTFLAAHDNVFLREQFENGDEGTLFKFEGIRVMQATVDGNPESLKLYQPIGWMPQFDIADLGNDKELYRWPFLIHNNRDKDDYSRIIDLAKAFSLSGDALVEAVTDVIDVDSWMSTFAIMSLFGIGDAYSQGNPHNLNLYVRPADNKVLAFPWDWDFVFSQPTNAPLHGGKNIGKVLDLPQFEHVFLGYLHHMITTMFNRREMQYWTTHFGQMLGGSYTGLLTNIEQRGSFVLGRLPDEVFFQIGTDAANVDATPLVDATTAAQVLIPGPENGGDQLGSAWIEPGFTESADWVTGPARIGFETTPATFDEWIDLDVSSMYTNNATAFIRIPFNLTKDPAEIDRLKLRMRYDDGFVAYLNGQEVASANAPNSPTWDSRASASQRNADAIEPVDFDLSAFRDLLQPGQNLLAIHGLNRISSSSDFLIVPELIAETFPELTDKTASVDAPSIRLDGQGWVNVREIRVAGESDALDVTWTDTTTWQVDIPLAPGENLLQLEAVDFSGNMVGLDRILVTSTVARPILDHLRISELMYHAADPTVAEIAAGFDDDNSFDFLELVNTSPTETLNLGGIHLEGGVQFAFPDISLSPGQHAVVADNVNAFQRRYGTEISVTGQYAGSLSNSGEALRLYDAAGTLVWELSYSDEDPWPAAADGVGASLEIIDVAATPVNELIRSDRWRASTEFGGSPGRSGLAPVGVVINEIMANTDQPLNARDSIELFNPTNQTIDLAGWYLSDSQSQLRKFQIPSGTVLGPGQYLAFDEDDFNPRPTNPGPNDFALSGSQGDEVWLVVPDGQGGIARFVDDVHFGPTLSGQSLGRVPNGTGRLVPMVEPTWGAANSAAQLGPLVISEIQAAPADPSDAARAIDPALDRDDLEFIEIHNVTSQTIDLEGWRLAGGVDFELGAGTSLAGGETMVIVSFNPISLANANRLAAFRAHYGMGTSVTIRGGYAGQLNDEGELLEWLQPDRSGGGPLDEAPRVLADEVLYDNRGTLADRNPKHRSIAHAHRADGPWEFGGVLVCLGLIAGRDREFQRSR